MKYLVLVPLFLLLSGCNAQSKPLLINQQLIEDWTRLNFYETLIDESTGTWKQEYTWIDSVAVYDITYLSDGLKVKGYITRPKSPGNYPCIIFNRGGNKEFGALEPATAFRFGRLAKEGYIIIASQYRGNGGGEGKEEFGGTEVNDILILPEVLAEVEGADTEKIGMYGWSRGGMMTYIALTQMDNIKAAAVGGALSDSFSGIEDRPEMEEVYESLVPNYISNKEAELTKRSAVKWADQFSKDVPILLMHGNADWRVKPEQSLNLALEFEKHRIPYRLIIFEGGDHGLSEHRQEVHDQVLAWFDKYLKEDAPLPNMEYHGR